MKRRHLLQTLAAAPAAAPLAAQTPAATATPVAGTEPQGLTLTAPSAAGQPLPTFLQPAERAALHALCAAMVPAALGKPGAVDCGVVEFLDFLLSGSTPDKQQLWRTGLHHLDAESLRLHSALFEKLTPAQIGGLLEPLKAKWTFYGPPEPFAKFLWSARDEILQATMNSREYSQANTGRRSAGGLNYYWRSLD